MRIAQRGSIQGYRIARHGLRTHESALRNGGDRVRHHAIRVVNVVNRSPIIVVVVNDGHIRDARIADVYVPPVTWSGVVPGNIRLTVAKREPTHTTAESDRDPPVRSPYPRYQRRCIGGSNVNRTWTPSPRAADVSPTAIVERRIAPRCIIDPSPTPGCNPNPVSEAIGRPSGNNHSRHPHRTVTRICSPGAIFIQVICSNGSGGYVASRDRAVLPFAADCTPLIESGRSWRFVDSIRH